MRRAVAAISPGGTVLRMRMVGDELGFIPRWRYCQLLLSQALGFLPNPKMILSRGDPVNKKEPSFAGIANHEVGVTTTTPYISA
jgi:hypothetical protein